MIFPWMPSQQERESDPISTHSVIILLIVVIILGTVLVLCRVAKSEHDTSENKCTALGGVLIDLGDRGHICADKNLIKHMKNEDKEND